MNVPKPGFSFLLQLVCIAFIAITDGQRPKEDLITNLPGLNFPTNYSQYSGYLDLVNDHHYHYWLTESQQNPDTDPVVIWLNGGPGCSSVGDGLLYELGPFHVYPNGSLWDNAKYSWNNNANVLYLESPVCVGFSYQNDVTNCSMNDNTTADDNYNAVVKFLDKFPIYKTNDMFVVGESYGGAYVPMLTRNILQGNKDGTSQINLKGFAVGNGITVREFNGNSRYWYMYHHGMISEEIWNDMLTNCCTSPYDKSSCPFIGSTDQKCLNALTEANTNCCTGVNMYDIYGPCYHYSDSERIGKTFSLKRYRTDIQNIGGLNGLNDIKDSDACLDDRGSEIYLNEMDVWNALHIRSIFNVTKWNECVDLSPSPYWLNYTNTKYAKDMRPIYDQIFELNPEIFMLIYHGDTDGVCNFLGGEWFIDNMNLTVTNEWREWYIEDENGKQVGGWTKDFKRGNGAHYATVRGSGHLVPQYAPVKALKLFQYFLMNKDLD